MFGLRVGQNLDKSCCLGTRMVLDARLLSESVPLEPIKAHSDISHKLVDRMLQALVHRLWLMRLEVLDAPTWELFLVSNRVPFASTTTEVEADLVHH